MWFWLFADPDPSGKPPADGSPASPSQPSAISQVQAAVEAEGGSPGKGKEQLIIEEDDHAPTSAMWIVLPWMTSLLLHVAIIVLGVVLIWSVTLIEEELEAIIPTARLAENVGGALSQSDEMQLEAAQDVREVESEEVDQADTMDDLDLTTESELELIGLTDGGGGGQIAPFGTTTGGGEMGAEFYGAGGNAMRIAYVIDASGSMIDTMPFVLEELKRSISALSERQEFTVVFYHADSAIEVPPEGWKAATTENKRRVADWITLEEGNVAPRGSTNPRPALRLVMRYRPELIFLLSDNITGTGRYEINRDELLSMLRQSSRGQQMAINTIQFMYPDPLRTLEAIAEEHNGVYRFITEADLGLR